MKNLLKIFSILFFLSSCATKAPSPHVGKKFYTQFAMYFEKNHFYTTNYKVGFLLPINSEVVIDKVNDKEIVFTVQKSQERLKIINVKKHTHETIEQAFNKIFNHEAVSLNKYSELEKRNINAGRIEIGMRKEAVVLAYGYPPKIQTSNLDINEWTYWKSRFNKITVNFMNGRISQIKN